MLKKLFGSPSSPLDQAQAANQTLNAAYAQAKFAPAKFAQVGNQSLGHQLAQAQVTQNAAYGTWLDSYDNNVPDDEAMVWRSLKTGPLNLTGTLTIRHLQRCLLS